MLNFEQIFHKQIGNNAFIDALLPLPGEAGLKSCQILPSEINLIKRDCLTRHFDNKKKTTSF